MVGMPKYLSEDVSAFLARNFYPNLNASCCLYSHVRKPWILVSSRISGIWRFGFFKFSGKNMKLEWCRVDIFEGQGEGRTEGKKVIIFFEIPSAQKAANPQDWAHINWSLSIYAISLLWSENESIFTEWAPRSCHQVHITTYWAWRWVAILAMSALCQIWGPIALGQLSHNCLSPWYWQSRGCGCHSLIDHELAKPSIWINQRPAFTSCFLRAILNSQSS